MIVRHIRPMRPERRRLLEAAVKRGTADGVMPWTLGELAARLNLHPGTVRDAFADFRRRGWVHHEGSDKRPIWRYDLAALALAAGVSPPIPRHDLLADFEPVYSRTSEAIYPRTSDDLLADFATNSALDTVHGFKTNFKPREHAPVRAREPEPLTPAENRDRIAALKASIRPAPADAEAPAPTPIAVPLKPSNARRRNARRAAEQAAALPLADRRSRAAR